MVCQPSIGVSLKSIWTPYVLRAVNGEDRDRDYGSFVHVDGVPQNTFLVGVGVSKRDGIVFYGCSHGGEDRRMKTKGFANDSIEKWQLVKRIQFLSGKSIVACR
jgi:hypothetical protein